MTFGAHGIRGLGSAQVIAPRCSARAKGSGRPCRQPAGMRTDHLGAGRCWLHAGNTPSGRIFGVRQALVRRNLDAMAQLTLAQIADRLARLAAAAALATTDPADLQRFAYAFARAADRAEGLKVTLEARVAWLAGIPDDEVDAAIATAERLVAEARSGVRAISRPSGSGQTVAGRRRNGRGVPRASCGPVGPRVALNRASGDA